MHNSKTIISLLNNIIGNYSNRIWSAMLLYCSTDNMPQSMSMFNLNRRSSSCIEASRRTETKELRCRTNICRSGFALASTVAWNYCRRRHINSLTSLWSVRCSAFSMRANQSLVATETKQETTQFHKVYDLCIFPPLQILKKIRRMVIEPINSRVLNWRRIELEIFTEICRYISVSVPVG